MRNEQRTWFLQNPAEDDRLAGIFGGAIMTELEQLDQQFVDLFYVLGGITTGSFI